MALMAVMAETDEMAKLAEMHKMAVLAWMG